MKYPLIICVSCLLAACGAQLTPEEIEKARQDSLMAVVIANAQADSAFCVKWRAIFDDIRKTLPDTAPPCAVSNHRYRGGSTSIPFMTYSCFMEPVDGKTPLDKFIFAMDVPVTTDNMIAQAESDVVWEPLSRAQYLYIYYPGELTVKGTINDKEPISGTTKGTVILYDLNAMEVAGRIEVSAAHDTGVPFDAFSGTTMTNVVYREMREQLIAQVSVK